MRFTKWCIPRGHWMSRECHRHWAVQTTTQNTRRMKRNATKNAKTQWHRTARRRWELVQWSRAWAPHGPSPTLLSARMHAVSGQTPSTASCPPCTRTRPCPMSNDCICSFQRKTFINHVNITNNNKQLTNCDYLFCAIFAKQKKF